MRKLVVRHILYQVQSNLWTKTSQGKAENLPLSTGDLYSEVTFIQKMICKITGWLLFEDGLKHKFDCIRVRGKLWGLNRVLIITHVSLIKQRCYLLSWKLICVVDIYTRWWQDNHHPVRYTCYCIEEPRYDVSATVSSVISL